LAVPAFAQTSSISGSTPAVARTKPGSRATAPSPSTGRFKPEIPVSAAIFTLDGVCAEQPKSKASIKSDLPCKTVITRGQLEALLSAIDPEAPPKAHQQFALSYARLLAASKLAEQRHLEKDPKIAREIQLQQSMIRMQVLTNYILQGLERQAQRISDAEIQSYYKANESKFEQAEVRRLAVPLGGATESGKPLEPEVVKAKLQELRDRATNGDDFDQLQTRAYKELGLKGALPSTAISMIRRQSQSPEELKIFDMDLGETSQVFEHQGVVMILRLDSKRQLTLNEVRPQIEAALQLQHTVTELQTAFKGITADFNLKYLDATSQPDLFPASVVTQNQLHHGLSSTVRVQP
jgi:hypothetical protein